MPNSLVVPVAACWSLAAEFAGIHFCLTIEVNNFLDVAALLRSTTGA
jgi:hypothetical protein